jgi:hypothetical protein
LPYGDTGNGWQLFFVGLVYCWVIPKTLPWWANVLYGWAVCCGVRGARVSCLGWALGAVALAALDAAQEESQCSPAYWAWIGSMILLALAAGRLPAAPAAPPTFSPSGPPAPGAATPGVYTQPE